MQQTVYQRLKIIFQTVGLNQTQFAHAIGIKPPSVSTLLAGKNNASTTTLKTICNTFNINYEWLLSGEGEMMKQEKPAYPFPVANDMQFWQEMVMRQQRSIESLSDALRVANEKIISLLLSETSKSSQKQT